MLENSEKYLLWRLRSSDDVFKCFVWSVVQFIITYDTEKLVLLII